MDAGELLAKPDETLLEHLKKVAEEGRKIAHFLELSPEMRKKALLACLFHDLGKATESFQAKMRGERGRAYPHPLASLPFIIVTGNLSDPLSLAAAAAVLTHHSPLNKDLYRDFKDKSADYVSEETLKDLLQELSDLIDEYQPGDHFPLYKSLKLINSYNKRPALLLEQNLRFGGETKTLRLIFKELPSQEYAAIKTVLMLADWVVSSRKFSAEDLFLFEGGNKLKAYLGQKNLTLRKFQRKMSQLAEKRVWLRAPTGTGKTEALLLWANDAKRIIYLLPTQATANAMWKRLRAIYGEDKVGLAHGRAGYILRKEMEEGPLDFKLWASVFAKPIVVATLDQYLMAHLQGRHWEIRKSLAKNSALIIDEIHSYDPYTLGLLKAALEQEPPYKLALASATLPEFLISLLGKGPLVEAEESLWKRKRHKIILHSDRLDNSVSQIVEEALKGKKVLVIVNTVAKAQEIYQLLYQFLKNETCLDESLLQLLHARFAFKDRWEREEKLQNPPSGTILISTQIVEVSLDISFDVLFTEIAPIDALVQRLGRINRRGDNPPAPVHVFLEWYPGSEKIYGRDILEISTEILKDTQSEPTDGEWVQATNELYEKVFSSPAYLKDLQEGEKTLKEIQEILGCYTIDLSDEELQKKFTTRKGQLSVEVLPYTFKDHVYTLKEQGELWRLVEFLVPVPLWWLGVYPQRFSKDEDLAVYWTDLFYDGKVGLRLPGEEETPSGAEIC
ncbi:CRISPR-associated helicase Cas3' [Caldanaerobacter subterraneus]|uniref:CRISPR-associated helicase Cas3 n=1 Tax=Caldanaerobacter subterraneus TaxID=911092 RepID=A0A7Y2L532_9THEO|nr:CRISPR-associated helicase Cas3' [Caldanaerobacter subterraneus]NNG65735.1 CRISPR-associated helicase Cas3' [Caldanaerobacter subterraneus]